jgi:enoyl-CoA hydratase/carnithine racemase
VETPDFEADSPLPALKDGVRFEQRDAVGQVTLARPQRLNALTFGAYESLRDLFAWLRAHEEVRAVVLTGTGRGFCSGGDVDEIIGRLLEMDAPELLEFTTLTCDVVRNMRACPQPIVAALNGTVAGAGAALAVASDIRLAVPFAKIAFLFPQAGLSSADMGATFLLPRIIGRGRAELLLTGRFLSAEQAVEWGLYSRIVEQEELMKESGALAQAIASGPSDGTRVSKLTIDAEVSMTLQEALDHDARVQAALMTHPDFREAHDAFKEKRAPRYP